MKPIPTPSQTLGPFFHRALERPAWSDLTAAGPRGEPIRVEGTVYDGDGAVVPDAMLEIWQANAAGRYAHPEDNQDKPLDPNFLGFGRACTGADGRYAFTTIRPGPVPGPGNSLQAPHIAVTVMARGLLKRLVTRVYFADQAGANAADPVLGRIEDAGVRGTLLAPRIADGPPAVFRFDIVLQGRGETAFFEL